MFIVIDKLKSRLTIADVGRIYKTQYEKRTNRLLKKHNFLDAYDTNGVNRKLTTKMVKNYRENDMHTICDNMDNNRNTIFVVCNNIDDSPIMLRVIAPN